MYRLQDWAAVQRVYKETRSKRETARTHPDSFINIGGSKYSMSVRCIDKTLLFRITYGFRIEIYDRKEKLVCWCWKLPANP